MRVTETVWVCEPCREADIVTVGDLVVVEYVETVRVTVKLIVALGLPDFAGEELPAAETEIGDRVFEILLVLQVDVVGLNVFARLVVTVCVIGETVFEVVVVLQSVELGDRVKILPVAETVCETDTTADCVAKEAELSGLFVVPELPETTEDDEPLILTVTLDDGDCTNEFEATDDMLFANVVDPLEDTERVTFTDGVRSGDALRAADGVELTDIVIEGVDDKVIEGFNDGLGEGLLIDVVDTLLERLGDKLIDIVDEGLDDRLTRGVIVRPVEAL